MRVSAIFRRKPKKPKVSRINKGSELFINQPVFELTKAWLSDETRDLLQCHCRFNRLKAKSRVTLNDAATRIKLKRLLLNLLFRFVNAGSTLIGRLVSQKSYCRHSIYLRGNFSRHFRKWNNFQSLHYKTQFLLKTRKVSSVARWNECKLKFLDCQLLSIWSRRN